MNTRTYLQLLDRDARLRLGWTLAMAVMGWIGMGVFPSPSPSGVVLYLTLFPAFFGHTLGGVIRSSMRCPACRLLPRFRQQLVGWTIGLALIGPGLWGGYLGRVHPELSFLLGASYPACIAILFVAASHTRFKRANEEEGLGLAMVLVACLLVVMGLRSSESDLSDLVRYQVAIVPVTVALTGWLGWLSYRKWICRPLEMTVPESGSHWSKVPLNELIGMGWKSRDLGQRRGSLRSWARVPMLERPGNTRILPLAVLFYLLVLPLLHNAGGYPRAWYWLVTLQGNGAEPSGAVMYWILLMFISGSAPLPRRDVLYPVSRSRRAQMAFWSSAGTWLAILGYGIGGALLFGAGAGFWLGTPLGPREILNFVAPAVVSLPAMALMRWGALYFEGRSDAALWMIVLITLPLLIASWMLVFSAPPVVAFGIAVVAGAGGLTAYYFGLRNYFTGEDLISPQPDKPFQVGGLLSRRL